MAQRAHELTLRYFGRAVNLFTPLYVSDYCTNQCRYCGFNANNTQPRRHLSPDEAYEEARAIADMGLQHILLLTGDARKLSSPEYIAEIARRIKPLFASVGIEVYSMTEDEYRLMVESGVDSMTMFQETYNPELYDWLHPVGPKKDYAFRLNAPERAARAGMRSLGLGALLGLDEFEQDAFATGLHAWWLLRHYPGVDVGLSIPRICSHEGSFDIPHALDDRRFVQYVTALRCFLPRSSITCSSRERLHARPPDPAGRDPRLGRRVHRRGRPQDPRRQQRPVRHHRPPQRGADDRRPGQERLPGRHQGLGRPHPDPRLGRVLLREGDPIAAVDARSFLCRNGHGPAGRHSVAAGARGGPPSSSSPPPPQRALFGRDVFPPERRPSLSYGAGQTTLFMRGRVRPLWPGPCPFLRMRPGKGCFRMKCGRIHP